MTYSVKSKCGMYLLEFWFDYESRDALDDFGRDVGESGPYWVLDLLTNDSDKDLIERIDGLYAFDWPRYDMFDHASRKFPGIKWEE